jgi:glycosyltransferase involved in cell wall biosynthesis
LRVLYFGTYDETYPRNTQVISCLRGAGVDVVELQRRVWERRESWSLGVRQLARIARAEASLRREPDHEVDAVIVGYPGHFDLPAARRVAGGRPVIFNPLVSLHDTLVGDRGRFRSRSLAARAVRRLDTHAFRTADLVVADTEAHAAFFRESFHLSPERVAVCLVGAEDRLFRPGNRPAEGFHALFVGKLIPLHGLEVILEAARLTPEIAYRVVGSGQLEKLLAGRSRNVGWVPWIDYEKLPAVYGEAACVLGVFGRTPKTRRVIPNKAFQAIACGRPLITADTPAARELLTDGSDAVLVPPGDARALAEAVRRLAADAGLAEQLGRNARATYLARASEQVLGGRWRGLLERACASR